MALDPYNGSLRDFYKLTGAARETYDAWRARHLAARKAHREWVDTTLGMGPDGNPYPLVYGTWTGLQGVVLPARPNAHWAKNRCFANLYHPRSGTTLFKSYRALPNDVSELELSSAFAVSSLAHAYYPTQDIVVMALPHVGGWKTTPSGAERITEADYHRILADALDTATAAVEGGAP